MKSLQSFLFPACDRPSFSVSELAAAVVAATVIAVVSAAAANQDDKNDNPQTTAITTETVTKAAHTYTSFACML